MWLYHSSRHLAIETSLGRKAGLVENPIGPYHINMCSLATWPFNKPLNVQGSCNYSYGGDQLNKDVIDISDGKKIQPHALFA